MTGRHLSPAEAQLLDQNLPAGLTPDMRDVALCLYEALVLQDERCGQSQPAPAWAAQLRTWAHQVRAQLQRLSSEKGGMAIYLPKGLAVYLSARDSEMCSRFCGNNYRQLAREYGLTEMRVRQIVYEWQRERAKARQHSLPGLE